MNVSGLPRLHLMTLAHAAVCSGVGKPIHGGVFGGRFLMFRGRGSPSGLVKQSVYVVDSITSVTVGMGRQENLALADARQTLATYTPEAIAEFIKGKESEWRARDERPRMPSIRSRRQAIFDSSKGQCHYCGTALTYDGCWHVEHRQPKSRGGSDESENLAAACGLCNLRKQNKTEAEFRAEFGLPEIA